MKKFWLVAVAAVGLTAGLAPVRTQGQAAPIRLYLIATAHLDSQWNWTVQDTIRDFVPKTFHTNFDFFEKYPNYVFSWEGAIHYMWFKEYHPEAWPTLQKYGRALILTLSAGVLSVAAFVALVEAGRPHGSAGGATLAA